MGLDLIQNHQL